MTREQLDAIRVRVDAATPGPWQVMATASFIASAREDVSALLAEVERLTADPLPAAAWVREVERAAFARGVSAMREAAIEACRPEYPDAVRRLRDLPDPEDK